MIAEMVEDLGHCVVAEAGGIDEAQRLAQTAEFDLALLDVNIGGHSIAGSESLPEPFGGRSVLQKPFVVSKLTAAIEAILDH
jgi:DNA-binding response OmpR family regulator